MKYLHKFNSAAEFEAAYNGNDYIEPWVSLTIDAVNDVNKVDYNKQPVVEEYDIEIDSNGQSDCAGQEILSMSTNVGPYQIIEDSGYMYTVTNSNLTTNPLPTLKVKVVNGPNNSDGVYECEYFDNGGNHTWEYSISDDPFMAVHVNAFNNDGIWELQAYLTEGC